MYDGEYEDLTDDVLIWKNHNDYTYNRKYDDHTDFVCTVGCKKSYKHVHVHKYEKYITYLCYWDYDYSQGQLLEVVECHIYMYCFTFDDINLNRAFVIIVLFPKI